jgi:DNA-directed RNA polymerase subunit L
MYVLYYIKKYINILHICIIKIYTSQVKLISYSIDNPIQAEMPFMDEKNLNAWRNERLL